MVISILFLTGGGSEREDTPKAVPQLPGAGKKLEDFVPEGWEIYDSVELDFNGDGLVDCVGILRETDMDVVEYAWNSEEFPRILFALAGDGTAGYRLDFQDNSLIRDRGGDLTAEGASFTTHTVSGSMLRWSPDHPNDTRAEKENTYTWSEGSWRQTLSEEYYGYGDYITEYVKNDWKNGVKIRKKRSPALEEIEKNYKLEEYENRESIVYDVTYELALEEGPFTLKELERQRGLSPYHVIGWDVEKVVFAEGVDLSEDMVKMPDEELPGVSCEWNENYVLYAFSSDSDTDGEVYYIAMYCRQDKTLSVSVMEESEIDDIHCYKGKIYYAVKSREGEAVVGVRLNRVDLDKSGKETIFEYRYPKTERKMMENEMSSLGLYFEIGGDEIVAQVYTGGGNPTPFYRMKTDGSGLEEIGQIPK